MIDPITQYILETQQYESNYSQIVRNLTHNLAKEIGKKCGWEQLKIDMRKEGHTSITLNNIPPKFRTRYKEILEKLDYPIKSPSKLLHAISVKLKEKGKK